MLKLILNSSSMLVLVLLVLPLLLLVLPQLLLLLPQLLLQLPLPQDANRRLTDSAELSQSSPAEQLLCQSVSQFLIVLLSQSVSQFQEPSLSPTVLLSPSVSQSPSAPRSQDKNVTQSPELFQRPSVLLNQLPSADLFHSQSQLLSPES